MITFFPQVQEHESKTNIYLDEEESVIQIDGASSHIICNNESIRLRLRDVMLGCLKQL